MNNDDFERRMQQLHETPWETLRKITLEQLHAMPISDQMAIIEARAMHKGGSIGAHVWSLNEMIDDLIAQRDELQQQLDEALQQRDNARSLVWLLTDGTVECL